MYRLAVFSGEICVILANDLLLGAIDKKRMIATFAQFHHGVHEVRNIRRRYSSFVEEREVSFKYCTVEFLLDCRQLDLINKIYTYIHVYFSGFVRCRLGKTLRGCFCPWSWIGSYAYTFLLTFSMMSIELWRDWNTNTARTFEFALLIWKHRFFHIKYL